MHCKCEIKHEGQELKLVADCRSCEKGKADLDEDVCFGGILEAWGQGLGADTIVLSGTIETQYSGSAVELIDQMSGLLAELHRLSKKRHPKDKLCERCKVSPSVIFGGLESGLKKDLSDFYMGYRAVATKISDASFHDRACADCLASTKDDLNFFQARFEDLLRFIIREGFSIVL